MRSLLDLPEEVLVIIGNYLDGTSLGILASMNPRLLSSAAVCAKRLRVPSVTPHLISLLSFEKILVRSLDLSNCFSESALIEAVILMCASVEELNIVNCNLSLATLRTALTSFKELKTLSFSYLGTTADLASLVDQEEGCFPVISPLRHLYVEMNPIWTVEVLFPLFLEQLTELERLHVHFIENFRQPPPTPSQANEVASPQYNRWRNLRTVMISSCSGANDCVAALLGHIFSTRMRPEHLDSWEDSERVCFIYEDGKFNTHVVSAIVPGEGNVLRDAYYFDFHTENLTFPWGSPRGLKIDFDLPYIALHRKHFFIGPVTWASELVELDLTGSLSDLPVGNWSEIIEASPALEAIGVPYCFFPTVYDSSEDRQPRKRVKGWRHSVLKFLKSIKLKRLLITGDCSHRYELPDNPPLTLRDYSVVGELPFLEELTLHNIYESPSLLIHLANDNVRVVRLGLKGEVTGLDQMGEFMEKCSMLKYFKLKATRLLLNCENLWKALAQRQSLKEICVETSLDNKIDFFAIEAFLPQIFENVDVLHVHADRARNRDTFFCLMRCFREEYVKKKPHRVLHFETEALASPMRVDTPSCFPGRSLCCMSNNIARIKPVGWALP